MNGIGNQRALAALLAAALLGAAGEAQAAPTNPQQPAAAVVPAASGDVVLAEDLYERGLKRIGENNYLEAAEMLEKSNALDPAMGTLFRLAECYEKLNRPTRAWTTFKEVAEAAQKQGLADREKLARDRAKAIEPSIGFIAISVSASVLGTPDLHVALDGQTIDNGKWKDTPQVTLVMDPGPHTLVATAPGKLPWRRTVTVRKGELPVNVAISEMRAFYTLPQTRPVQPVHQQWGAQRTAAVTFAIFGSVAMSAAHVGALLFVTGNEEAGIWTSAVGGATGIASLAAAGILWHTAPTESKSSRARGLQLTPVIGSNGAFGLVRGNF